jgi:hypothetical protein
LVFVIDMDILHVVQIRRHITAKMKIIFNGFFQEQLPRTRLKMIDPVLMETVFLANHCILDGFENAKKAPEYDKKYGQFVSNALECMTATKIQVLKHVHDGYYSIQMAKLNNIVAEEKANNESTMSQEEKKDKIRKLQEELAKLTQMA